MGSGSARRRFWNPLGGSDPVKTSRPDWPVVYFCEHQNFPETYVVGGRGELGGQEPIFSQWVPSRSLRRGWWRGPEKPPTAPPPAVFRRSDSRWGDGRSGDRNGADQGMDRPGTGEQVGKLGRAGWAVAGPSSVRRRAGKKGRSGAPKIIYGFLPRALGDSGSDRYPRGGAGRLRSPSRGGFFFFSCASKKPQIRLVVPGGGAGVGIPKLKNPSCSRGE